MNPKSLLTYTLGATVALATLTGAATAGAQTFTEGSDAGQTLVTAANTNATAGTNLSGISGTIGTSDDADLYKFTISAANPIFSAVANGGTSSVAGNGAIDTSIFLFDLNGNALFANDDRSGTNYQGALTGITLAPGTYYLGISLSGNEPVNSANQLLFTVDQPTTAVRGPASGLNPTTESTFNGGTFLPETGAYTIAISAVPEPSAYVLVALGAGAALPFFRRLRRQQTA